MCNSEHLREMTRQSGKRSWEWNRETLLQYLIEQEIAFDEAVHHAVCTMAESAAIGVDLPGSRCKNLLVRDKKTENLFLVVTRPNISLDLGELGRMVGVGRLSLCPPEDMQCIVHVTPGSLSPLALVADTGLRKVRILMDASLRSSSTFLFHPLVNTSTVSIAKDDLVKFVQSTGHCIEYVDMPARHLSRNKPA